MFIWSFALLCQLEDSGRSHPRSAETGPVVKEPLRTEHLKGLMVPIYPIWEYRRTWCGPNLLVHAVIEAEVSRSTTGYPVPGRSAVALKLTLSQHVAPYARFRSLRRDVGSSSTPRGTFT